MESATPEEIGLSSAFLYAPAADQIRGASISIDSGKMASRKIASRLGPNESQRRENLTMLHGRWQCHTPSSLAFCELRQVVVYLVPLGLRGDEIMRGRRRRQRRIERPQTQAHNIRHRIAATDDRRTAVGTEEAMNAWRRIEYLQRRLALDDNAVTGRDRRIGRI